MKESITFGQALYQKDDIMFYEQDNNKLNN